MGAVVFIGERQTRGRMGFALPEKLETMATNYGARYE
jgi:hypothetical protein